MYQIPEKLITTTIGNFCEISDIGRSKVYELLDNGDLDSIKIGKRRLIILDSYRKLIEQRRTAASPTHGGDGRTPGLVIPIASTAAPRRRGRPRKAVQQAPASVIDGSGDSTRQAVRDGDRQTQR